MTDTRTHTGTERLVFAPHDSDGERLAWVEGQGRDAGCWMSPIEAQSMDDQARVSYAEVDPADALSGLSVVRVPADEPASKADLMAVASQVADLERRWRTLTTRLTGVAAIIDMRNSTDG